MLNDLDITQFTNYVSVTVKNDNVPISKLLDIIIKTNKPLVIQYAVLDDNYYTKQHFFHLTIPKKSNEPILE